MAPMRTYPAPRESPAARPRAPPRVRSVGAPGTADGDADGAPWRGRATSPFPLASPARHPPRTPRRTRAQRADRPRASLRRKPHRITALTTSGFAMATVFAPRRSETAAEPLKCAETRRAEETEGSTEEPAARPPLPRTSTKSKTRGAARPRAERERRLCTPVARRDLPGATIRLARSRAGGGGAAGGTPRPDGRRRARSRQKQVGAQAGAGEGGGEMGRQRRGEGGATSARSPRGPRARARQGRSRGEPKWQRSANTRGPAPTRGTCEKLDATRGQQVTRGEGGGRASNERDRSEARDGRWPSRGAGVVADRGGERMAVRTLRRRRRVHCAACVPRGRAAPLRSPLSVARDAGRLGCRRSAPLPPRPPSRGTALRGDLHALCRSAGVPRVVTPRQRRCERVADDAQQNARDETKKGRGKERRRVGVARARRGAAPAHPRTPRPAPALRGLPVPLRPSAAPSSRSGPRSILPVPLRTSYHSPRPRLLLSPLPPSAPLTCPAPTRPRACASTRAAPCGRWRRRSPGRRRATARGPAEDRAPGSQSRRAQTCEPTCREGRGGRRGGGPRSRRRQKGGERTTSARTADLASIGARRGERGILGRRTANRDRASADRAPTPPEAREREPTQRQSPFSTPPIPPSSPHPLALLPRALSASSPPPPCPFLRQSAALP